MTTALYIVLASMAYFVLASRLREQDAIPEALDADDTLEAEILEE